MTAGHGGDPLGRWLRDLLRAAQWHRRLLAAALLAGAMAFALHTLAPPAPPTAAAVSAARDLPAGTRLTEDDLTVARVDPAAVPDGALSRAALARGRTLVSAVRRGELLTDVRLVGAAAVDRLGPGLVAAPVRIADADSAGLLRPGDVVDVLAAGAPGDGVTGGPARLVASAVRVVTIPRPTGRAFVPATGDGSLVVLATSSTTAARLAGAAVTERLSVVVRGAGTG
jgi:Flp pilus assembly protein CpaB